MSIIDTRTLDNRDGFDLRAELVPDTETDWDYAHDYNGEASSVYDAYRRGDWNHVGIIVIASRAGIDLGSDSVWACEHGLFPDKTGFIDALSDNGSWSMYGPDLIDNAIADARMKLSELADAE